MTTVLITGATGYMGRTLGEVLHRRGHHVVGLVRRGSQAPLSRGVQRVEGNALDPDDVAAAMDGCDTVVHLVGTPHPAPWKQRLFEEVDAVSLHATATAAAANARRNLHVVYVSVAHPAPTMKSYIAVRTRCEEELAHLALRRTILRPWYVLGPGHRWPILLRPFYRLAERVPSTRAAALRLGLVTLPQMVAALAWAVEHPPADSQILDVPAIRRHSS